MLVRSKYLFQETEDCFVGEQVLVLTLHHPRVPLFTHPNKRNSIFTKIHIFYSTVFKPLLNDKEFYLVYLRYHIRFFGYPVDLYNIIFKIVPSNITADWQELSKKAIWRSSLRNYAIFLARKHYPYLSTTGTRFMDPSFTISSSKLSSPD